MQSRVEELLVLGDYKPEARTGPAIWIRCLVDGALAEPALPAGRPPIVYLTDVARQDLYAGEECWATLKPLVDLMYRGTMWLQPNGNDWGVDEGFLRVEGQRRGARYIPYAAPGPGKGMGGMTMICAHIRARADERAAGAAGRA